MRPMRVLIMYDHIGDEATPDQADALTQARAIAAALEKLGHEWMTLGVTLDLEAVREAVSRLNPDLVFNLVESLGGAGRLLHTVPALLDVMGVPYTGASAEAQFVTSHKTLAKELLFAAKIPTPDWTTMAKLRRNAALDTAHAVAGERWILKSLWEHASVGIDASSVITTNSPAVMLRELEQRLDQLGGDGYAEEYIDGREFNVALLGRGSEVAPGVWAPQALPPAEIAFRNLDQWGARPRIVNYDCKWNEQSFDYHNTERVFEFPEEDQPLLERLVGIAKACWIIFDLRGYARVDFRVDSAGEPWVLEVNTNPCLSPDAGFAATLERHGMDYAEAIARILDDVPTRADRTTSTVSKGCGEGCGR